MSAFFFFNGGTVGFEFGFALFQSLLFLNDFLGALGGVNGLEFCNGRLYFPRLEQFQRLPIHCIHIVKIAPREYFRKLVQVFSLLFKGFIELFQLLRILVGAQAGCIAILAEFCFFTLKTCFQ